MSTLRQYTRLLQFVKPYWVRLVFATMSMGVVAAATAGVPALIKPIIDDVFFLKQHEKIVPLALGAVALFTVKGIFGFIQGYLMGSVGHRAIADLRHRLIKKLLDNDLQFFVEETSGDIVSRLTYDTTQIQGAVTKATTALFQHILTIIGLVIYIFYLHWQLSLAAIAIFPIAVFPVQRFGKLIRGYARRGQVQMGTLNDVMFEMLRNIRVIKTFRLRTVVESRIGNEIEHLYETFRKVIRTDSASHPVMEWIGSIGIAAIIIIGGELVIARETMSPGAFFSYLAAVGILYDPVRRMNGTWQQIQHGVAAAERIFAWLDMEPKIHNPKDGVTLDTVQEGIRLRDLTFSYQADGERVLQDVNLEVPVGHVIALVGSSGSGKSTIVNLLPRFYDPIQGAIEIDGVDLRQFDLDSLRSRIAIVDQHTTLFNDSVANNIGYGRKDASQQEIIDVAKAAFAHEFIEDLPQGYDTVIGEDGITLSGGQRQRIAIARALLKDAPLLILDEATSALDTESERAVQKALDRLLKGRTGIVIAHRLSTIRAVDQIYVLEEGRLVENGTHAELLEKQAAYYRFHQLQMEEPV